jgi:hypothetical protein
MSVFDTLEDLGAHTILAKVDRIGKQKKFNLAWYSTTIGKTGF